MGTTRLFAVAVCAAAFVGVGATAALAGEGAAGGGQRPAEGREPQRIGLRFLRSERLHQRPERPADADAEGRGARIGGAWVGHPTRVTRASSCPATRTAQSARAQQLFWVTNAEGAY